MFKRNVSSDPVVQEDRVEIEVGTNQVVIITSSNEGVEIVRDGLSYKVPYKPTPVELVEEQAKVIKAMEAALENVRDAIVGACLEGAWNAKAQERIYLTNQKTSEALRLAKDLKKLA